MKLRFKTSVDSSHLEQQRSLFKICFPETANSPLVRNDHYFWKFHSFPSSPNSFEYVAYSENEMVGYYGVIPYKYQIQGKKMTAGMVCDVMTHPKARGKGVFVKLGHFATENLKTQGIEFTTGYPIRPEVIPGHLKVGWHIGFELPMFLAPLKVNSILKEKKLTFLSPVLNLALRSLNFFLKWHQKMPLGYKTEIVKKELFLDCCQYDSFISDWQKSIPNCLLKERKFLRWRYSAPNADYNFWYLRKDSQLVGVAVTRKLDLNNIPSMAVLDLMILDNHIHIAPKFLQKIKTKAFECNCEVVVGMFSKIWSKKYRLINGGFLKTPFIFKFIVKRLTKELDDNFLNETNWHLTWVDSDDL